MAKSMTGYGRSELGWNGRKFTVEIKSVNNRYLDINIRMPRQFNPFEAQLRALLKDYITRGKVDVYISFEDLSGESVCVTYNRALAGQYLERLSELAQDYHLLNNMTADRLSTYPGVFTEQEVEPDESQLHEPLQRCLQDAAQQFLEARIKEGAFIESDLLKKLDDIQKLVDFIAGRAPSIVEAYQKRLKEKMTELLSDANIDETRILQETALYSDKVCIDEELVRLRSHLRATRDALSSAESVGRKLDFLAQEMNREANTILSKTDDAQSAAAAIELKTEIEKVREQIQNLE